MFLDKDGEVVAGVTLTGVTLRFCVDVVMMMAFSGFIIVVKMGAGNQSGEKAFTAVLCRMSDQNTGSRTHTHTYTIYSRQGRQEREIQTGEKVGKLTS